MTYDVKINGAWLSSIADAVLFERRLPVLPEVESNTLKVAGTDGEIDFGNTYGPRLIELTFMITSAPDKFHTTLARLARIFNGNRREITLEFADIPNRIYRAVNNGTLALDGQVGSRMVSVSLKANDPWPESNEKVTEFTVTQSPQLVIIESSGDVNTDPVITLTNMGTTTIRNFRITNEYTIN